MHRRALSAVPPEEASSSLSPGVRKTNGLARLVSPPPPVLYGGCALANLGTQEFISNIDDVARMGSMGQGGLVGHVGKGCCFRKIAVLRRDVRGGMDEEAQRLLATSVFKEYLPLPRCVTSGFVLTPARL